MRRLSARARRTDRGAAAVEFALVLVPLMLLIFGIIDYGFMLSYRQTLSQAATEGARAAAVQIDPGKRQTDAYDAIDDAMGSLTFEAATCGTNGLVCGYSEAACGDAQCVTVTVSYAYEANSDLQVPFDGIAIPDNLSYSATVRVS